MAAIDTISAPSTPSGFSISANSTPSRVPGVSPAVTVPITSATRITQSSGRQRRDGRCPSGKSRSRSVNGMMTAGNQNQLSIQAATSKPAVPGRTTYA